MARSIANEPDKHDHHITPVYYLSGFTSDSSSTELWQLQQGKPPVRTGIRGLGFIKNFYAFTLPDGRREFNEIENWLAYDIETPANAVIQKIRNLILPDAQDKQVLSRYISAMLTRTLRHKMRLEAIYPEKLEEILSGVSAWLDRMAEEHPDKLDRVDELRQQLHDGAGEYRAGVPDWLWVKSVSDRYTALFEGMNWVFFTASGRRGYITGDNPVFYPEGIGLFGSDETRAKIEMSFPISKDVALWASWRPSVMNFTPATEPIVHEINHRTAYSRARFLYYHGTPKWVIALNNKPKASFRLRAILL